MTRPARKIAHPIHAERPPFVLVDPLMLPREERGRCLRSRRRGPVAASPAAWMLTLALATAAQAQEKSPEDRLRDALRQSVEEMRAAQDQVGQLQSQLATAQQERDAAKAAQAAAEQKLAALAGKAQAKPEEVTALQAQLQQANAQTAALQSGLSKYESAYRQAAEAARAKDEQARQTAAGLEANTRALETCKTYNKRLIGTAEDILHLYQQTSFRNLLLKSYDPIIGFARVKLENIVQDYDDKIQDQQYIPGAKPISPSTAVP